MSRPWHQPADFTVGWVCAIPEELAAATTMLDVEYTNVCYEPQGYLYTFGNMGGHNVAIGCLPAGKPGTSPATAVGMDMKAHFKRMRFCVMVGIGGGVPSDKNDIRLGDVVVSQPAGQYGGVVQYDFGKRESDGFRRTGSLNSPPTVLLNALSRVKANRITGRSKFLEYLSTFENHPQFTRKQAGPDILFKPDCEHQGNSHCNSCDQNKIFQREERAQAVDVHFGNIASGNQVMKKASVRDAISAQLEGVLCFEMEAAGLMDTFPCLVVRGISDYADSHKRDDWKMPAAASAAAFTKDLLSALQSWEVNESGSWGEIDVMQEWAESMIESLNTDTLLQSLSLQQQRRTCTTPAERNNPQFVWIFKNIDFEAWESADSGSLWVSGPMGANINQFSAYLRQREQTKRQNRGAILVSYICTAAMSSKAMHSQFIQTFLRAAVESLSSNGGLEITKHFLRIISGLWMEDTRSEWAGYADINRGDSFKTLLQKLLRAPAPKQWMALSYALWNLEKRILIIVEDGHFAGIAHNLLLDLLEFTRTFQGTSTKVKLLFTSLPRTELKGPLDSVNVVNIEHDSERQACLWRLYIQDSRYQKIASQHESSFKWIWDHCQYDRWFGSTDSRLLYLQGKPGSGKSTITKYVREGLVKQLSGDAIVAKFFYSYREGEVQKSHYSMLRSIIWDIVRQDEAFFYHRVQHEYRLQSDSSNEWDYDSLKGLLSSLKNYSTTRPLYLILDAVDESTEKDRRDILQLFFDLCANTTQCVVKVFIASRPVSPLDRLSGIVHHRIRLQDETKGDIKRYTSWFLEKFELPGFHDEALEYITANAEGIFLWVKLVCDELWAYEEQGRSRDHMFKYLKSLPTELNDFYRHMIRQMGGLGDNLQDVLQLFRFVLFARRPLAVMELLHTLAVDLTETFDTSDQGFTDRIPTRRRIAFCGGNFLEIKLMNRTETVQVMHQTVREFFLERISHGEEGSDFAPVKQDPHRFISITCARYVMICVANAAPDAAPPEISSWTAQHYEKYVEYLETRPLAVYAFAYLRHHVQQHTEENNRYIISEFANFPRSQHVLLLTGHWQERITGDAPLTKQQNVKSDEFRRNLLWTASRIGLCTAVTGIISLETSVNAKDRSQRTALLHAAINGHEPLVAALMEHPNIEFDSSDMDGRTPLSWAAENGYTEIARQLLSQKAVNVNSMDAMKRRSLHWAAMNGHKDVTQLLLEQEDIMVDVSNGKGFTPLALAAKGGHESLVQLLLPRSTTSSADIYGRPALSWAAGNGHETTVRLLLNHTSSEADSRSQNGRTPLSYAAENGHDTIVHIFLSRGRLDVNVNSQDRTGRTPLSFAAEKGHESVVRLLVGYKAVDATLADEDSRPPLTWASEYGHPDIVGILMECPEVDVHHRDKIGLTALQWATEKCHGEVVALLTAGQAHTTYLNEHPTQTTFLLEKGGRDQDGNTHPRTSCIEEHAHAHSKHIAEQSEREPYAKSDLPLQAANSLEIWRYTSNTFAFFAKLWKKD